MNLTNMTRVLAGSAGLIGLIGSLGVCVSGAAAGPAAPTHAYIIEGSGFFGAPGIELATVGRVNLSDPSDVERFPIAGEFLRYGGADTAGDGLIAFENTTNSLRVLDPSIGGNTLVDSIGYMDSGVAGLSLGNDGRTTFITTTVGAFVRFVVADGVTGEVSSVHNILTNPISSLAVVPLGHPTLAAGDLYGLALTFGGGVRLVRIDLDTNSIASDLFVSGIGFNAQFETGLDFAPGGTLYATIQGFDEVSPNVFVEISSHLFMIDPVSGVGTDLGVIESNQTWDAVTLVIDEGAIVKCKADLTGDGTLDFFDISAFLTAFANQDPVADFTDDGAFDFFDISAFLTAFGNGCP
ncbi:MAG: hypothetical protein JKY43_01715 [Phycisphaerales bacterium]|nr:hypothetical protein [Phycisphaerales bacterium]